MVTEKVAELLCAQVFVIDRHSVAIASSKPELVGRPFNRICSREAIDYLRVPLSVDGQVGEVIVGALNGEVISHRLAHALVELVINQTAVIDALPNQHELKNNAQDNPIQCSRPKKLDGQYSFVGSCI